jgi:hypothetical protein
VKGVELQFWMRPLAGLCTCTGSFTHRKPYHSLAGVLPSTGWFQSNLGLRLGIDVV